MDEDGRQKLQTEDSAPKLLFVPLWEVFFERSLWFYNKDIRLVMSKVCGAGPICIWGFATIKIQDIPTHSIKYRAMSSSALLNIFQRLPSV